MITRCYKIKNAFLISCFIKICGEKKDSPPDFLNLLFSFFKNIPLDKSNANTYLEILANISKLSCNFDRDNSFIDYFYDCFKKPLLI
jgi:hypothetical protein